MKELKNYFFKIKIPLLRHFFEKIVPYQLTKETKLLVTEMFKVKIGFSSDMKEILE